jgi:hypothetical protein
VFFKWKKTPLNFYISKMKQQTLIVIILISTAMCFTFQGYSYNPFKNPSKHKNTDTVRQKTTPGSRKGSSFQSSNGQTQQNSQNGSGAGSGQGQQS